ncbi:MAG: FecR family protein [Candidatus Aureabacteria bacterium]|nr:FecR family protein [Candidatus Auribacterota bacterium]
MTRKNIIFLIIPIIVLLAIWGAYVLIRRPAPEATPLRILSSRGTADLYRSSNASWEKAAPNAAVEAGDVVSTGSGGTLDLGEAKLYALRLRGETQLAFRREPFPDAGKETAFRLKEGRVAAVTYADFTGARLVIETSQARVTARGTAFSVEAIPGKGTTVAVESGEADVVMIGPGDSSAPIAVTGGMSWTWSGEGTAGAASPLPPAEAKALREEIADIGRGVWEVAKVSSEEGKEKPISLILSSSPGRVDELLMPCGLYVSEAVPLNIYNLLLKASETARDGDYEGSVKILYQVLDLFPDRRAVVPLKLLAGAQYWALLDRPGLAIPILGEVVREGDPESAALAQAAVATIYGKLSRRAFADVLKKFGGSPEAERAKEALGKGL